MITIRICINRSYISWTCQIVTFSIFASNRILYRIKISYSTMFEYKMKVAPKTIAIEKLLHFPFKQVLFFFSFFKCKITESDDCSMCESNARHRFICLQRIFYEQSLYLILNVLNGKCRICHAIWDRFETFEIFSILTKYKDAAARTKTSLPD